MIWTHMLDAFQSFQVVPKMINSDRTKSCILTCFTQWLIWTQAVFIGFFRIAKPTVLRAMLIIIFEGALTNRLNLFHFFIFADFFPPTAWNVWLARHLFLTCSWFARVQKNISYFLALENQFLLFLFFSIFLTLVTLYLEVGQHIYMECTKLEKKLW